MTDSVRNQALTVGTMCIVVKTAHPNLLGRICECVSDRPSFPQFGAYIFRFQDGEEYYGDAHNVRPITPPPGDVQTWAPRAVEHA
jgi:hypothetical protein